MSSACDACKRRKVKCDQVDPCANCRISHLPCGYTTIPRKRGRKARRLSAEPALGESASPQGSPFEALAPTSLVREQQAETSQSIRAITNFPKEHSWSTGHPDGHEWIVRGLVEAVNSALSVGTITDIVRACIDTYLQYIFPNQPIADEPHLWVGFRLFKPGIHQEPRTWSGFPILDINNILSLKCYTHVTALCAFVTSVVPDSLIQKAHLLTSPFLKASRAMLRVYEDYDLENPDSYSLNIRMWHSAALQNSTGRLGASWHCHGEAALIAQRLRLNSEERVARRDAREAQRLRAGFWHLYSAERSAEALETRPVVLHAVLFHEGLTLLEQGESYVPFLDDWRDHNQNSLDQRLLPGFHLKCRVWIAAAELISGIKSYAHQRQSESTDSSNRDLNLSRLAELYISFSCIVDNLPDGLWSLDGGNDPNTESDIAQYQRNCFMVQRSNIMTSFHCMKLVALQHCIKYDVVEIMGLRQDPPSLAIKKIEIASEFIRELRLVSFVCFKMQGETAVEKIRRVGATLLELIQTTDHGSIKTRASSLFEGLLDYLSKLDSKASDELSCNYIR